MKKILFLMLLPFMALAQSKKEKEVMLGLNYLNTNNERLFMDSTLCRKSREVSVLVSSGALMSDIEYKLGYGGLNQEFIVFATKIAGECSGDAIPDFFADKEPDFLRYIQYKYYVGVYITDSVCVISFYKKKGIVSLASY